ncbi:MAG: MerR family transcriptional regulator [Tepidiformaceae bacterium]
MENETLTIGEVAAKAGVNIQTLRYYERRGLLAEPHRHHTGHRRYQPDAVDFIRSIKKAQSLGFTLDEIEGFVALAERKPAVRGEALDAGARRKIAELDQKIADLQEMRGGLERLIHQRCDSLTDCSCGQDCPVGPAANEGTASVAKLGAPPAEVRSSADRRLLGIIPVALLACLVCFLPAVVSGGLLAGGVGALSLSGIGGDLPLVLGAATIGAGAATVFLSKWPLRHGGGGSC